MNNYKLKIQYDGTNYAGWQIQENASTVQQKIVETIEVLTKFRVNLIGSGRTDSGVHALGQVANFKIDVDLDLYRFSHSLNAILPKDISITGIHNIGENFHSRFDAKKRSYIYLISKIKSPFYYPYSWHYHEPIDILKLRKLSEPLIGRFDFTSFARKNTETENKVCEVFQISWRESKEFVIFFIEANRFLHGMVRTIVGTLMKLVKEKEGTKLIKELINLKDREAAGEAVPAQGLFLYKVNY
ncbi:MAG: tRNA pseudouridine(38-40) synthase TruA [Ignavibacteriaceae bacterium]